VQERLGREANALSDRYQGFRRLRAANRTLQVAGPLEAAGVACQGNFLWRAYTNTDGGMED